VFIRIDPPVDDEYVAATLVLDLVDASRTALINSPAALRSCREHLMALGYRDLVPPTTVTASPDTIKAFLNERGRAVIKPVDSHLGRGSFLLSPGDPNLNSIIESTTNRGCRVVVVQQYLSQVSDGSKRIVVLDGDIVGAGLRHPVTGDFRISNPDSPADVNERDRLIVDRLRPALRDHGLRLVCLDVIGEFLIEVNITSPGALRKLDGLLGTRICADVVQKVLIRDPLWA
jgi:glutathione synthase